MNNVQKIYAHREAISNLLIIGGGLLLGRFYNKIPSGVGTAMACAGAKQIGDQTQAKIASIGLAVLGCTILSRIKDFTYSPRVGIGSAVIAGGVTFIVDAQYKQSPDEKKNFEFWIKLIKDNSLYNFLGLNFGYHAGSSLQQILGRFENTVDSYEINSASLADLPTKKKIELFNQWRILNKDRLQEIKKLAFKTIPPWINCLENLESVALFSDPASENFELLKGLPKLNCLVFWNGYSDTYPQKLHEFRNITKLEVLVYDGEGFPSFLNELPTSIKEIKLIRFNSTIPERFNSFTRSTESLTLLNPYGSEDVAVTVLVKT